MDGPTQSSVTYGSITGRCLQRIQRPKRYRSREIQKAIQRSQEAAETTRRNQETEGKEIKVKKLGDKHGANRHLHVALGELR